MEFVCGTEAFYAMKKYEAVAEAIKEEIKNKTYRDGQALPTEEALTSI